MTADKGAYLYLQKKTQDISKAKKSGLREFIRYHVLKLAFSLPLKFKVPTVATPQSEFATLISLDIEWAQIKKDTIQLLSTLNDNDYTKDIWRHPVSGKMNLFQMVSFASIHFDRHQSQIEKTLRSLK